MLRKRVVVGLDVQDGRAVESVNFSGLRDVGDPVELAQRYETEGADEVIFQDVSASADARRALLDTVGRTAENLFVPLTVSGGINDISDIALLLRAGADKVCISTAAVTRPELIAEAVDRFGSHCIAVSVNARQERRQVELIAHADAPTPAGAAAPATWFRVFTHGGRSATELDAIEWTRRCAELGAGEILITSIDQHGRRTGYDLELTARVVEAVSVPVTAGGGAGSTDHIRDAFLLAGADAAMVADILHDGSTTIAEIKRQLARAGIPVREGPLELPQP